jgi:hypothetical protein
MNTTAVELALPVIHSFDGVIKIYFSYYYYYYYYYFITIFRRIYLYSYV